MGRTFLVRICFLAQVLLLQLQVLSTKLVLLGFIGLSLPLLMPKPAAAQIGLPSPPRPVLAPNMRGGSAPTLESPNVEIPEALRKRRDQRKQDEIASQPKPPTPMERQQEALKEEAVKPRPFNFLAAIDFVLPQITTSGDRKDYTSDLTAHHYGLFRLGAAENEGANTGGTSAWIGYRIAPFSGSGKGGGSTGRYGFTYFGPMVALGKFSPGARSIGQQQEVAEEQGESSQEDLSRQGLMVGAGLSAMSQNGAMDPGKEEPFEDFDSKPVVFDSPGLFVQLQFIHVLHGAIGINYVVGAQLGKEKTFTWGGIGVSAFH